MLNRLLGFSLVAKGLPIGVQRVAQVRQLGPGALARRTPPGLQAVWKCFWFEEETQHGVLALANRKPSHSQPDWQRNLVRHGLNQLF